MENKQLDFNAPFLSVRRLSSKSASSDKVKRKIIDKSLPHTQHSLPLYKSDWEQGELTKPVAVPFHWERIPGKAKDGSKRHSQPLSESSSTPRLPPGRASDIIKHVSREEFDDQHVSRPQIEAYLFEGFNNRTKANENSGLDGEDDAYSDAFDLLSQTESFSWNYCSVSGLSSCDGPDVKSSGTFSIDPQTRDFMMSRFIPAAKAMVLDTPQYVSRKQHVVNERPRLVKKALSGELRPGFEQYGFNTISHYGQYIYNVQSELEDEKYDDAGKKSGKARGLFPWFGIKNSLNLLNRVPGRKPRTQAPISPSYQVRRPARTACSGPLPQTLDKHTWDAAYRKKSQCVVQSQELHDVENTLTGKSSQFNHHSSELCTTEGSSPYRCSRGGRISPYRNQAPRSPFHDGATFLGIPKAVENFEANKYSSINKGGDNFPDVSSHQIFKQGSGSVSPLVEKILYMDSLNNLEVPILDLVSSEAEGLMNSPCETLVESRGVQESYTDKSSIQDILKPKAIESLDVDLPSSDCISNLSGQADRTEGLKLDQVLDQDSRSLECSKANPNGNLDMNKECPTKEDYEGNSSVGSFQSPLPPPLLKSPSESWLWRTLPSISLRNLFSQVHIGNQFHSKKQGQKNSPTGTKWETIVKTSNLHHDHVRYSEELIPHETRHSKT